MSHARSTQVFRFLSVTVTAAALLGFAAAANAHCDTMNGPVIPEARVALDRADITPVLKWVKPEAEPELRSAFASAVQVRSMGPEAKTLADTYFFETLIRLHRAGEGAPYTGLKDVPPEEIVGLADESLAGGSPDKMIQALQTNLATAIREKFEAATAAGKTKDESVVAGREYVEAYVRYMHYVEGLHAAILSAGSHGGEIPEGGSEPEGHGERRD